MNLNLEKLTNDVINDIDINKLIERKVKKYINEYIETQFIYEQTYRGEFIIGNEWSEKIKPVVDNKLNELLQNNVEKIVEDIFNKQINKIIRNTIDSEIFNEMVTNIISENCVKMLRKKLK